MPSVNPSELATQNASRRRDEQSLRRPHRAGGQHSEDKRGMLCNHHVSVLRHLRFILHVTLTLSFRWKCACDHIDFILIVSLKL